MSCVWINEKTVRQWVLPRRPVGGSDVQEMACGHFQQKYDQVQTMIRKIGCMDELLSGMYVYIIYRLDFAIYFLLSISKHLYSFNGSILLVL